jgi:methionyl aminopeptidase
VRRRDPEIEYKTPAQIVLMREAGLVVARALAALREAAVPGASTADLDALAERIIRAAGAVPSFKGYDGYPATICASVNEQVVHAIPSARQVLRPGDLISIDCGAVLNGWHGDAAISVVVGPESSGGADEAGAGGGAGRAGPGGDAGGSGHPELRKLVAATEEALWAGVRQAARGVRSGRGRLGDVSFAIESSIRAARRYGIVRGYGGHGIGSQMHQDPFVLNHGRPGRGPDLVPGLCIAIEPMLTMGKAKTVELHDGWTVVTADGSVAAHAEHTIALCDDGAWVLTAADGGAAQLGELLASAAQHSGTPTGNR